MTRTVATGRGTNADDWTWRVSVADITQEGPFSIFPGVDRHLTLIEGPGIILRGDGGTTRVERIGDFAVFRGEAVLDVGLIDGPVRVWNVLTRRGAVRGSVRFVRELPVELSQTNLSICLVLDGEYALRLPGDRHERFRKEEGFQLNEATAAAVLRADSRRDVVLIAEIHT